MSDIHCVIDQSTTATTFFAYDVSGTLIASSQVPHKQISPHSGWLEHDPQEIIQNLRQSISQVLKDLKTLEISISRLKSVKNFLTSSA